jgi:hypothetical protein
MIMLNLLGSIAVFVGTLVIVPLMIWLLAYMERSLEENESQDQIPRQKSINLDHHPDQDHHNDSERMPA